MRSRTSEVIQDVGVVTARVFEGVGEDGQSIEGPSIVDTISEASDRATLPTEPERIAMNLPKGVPNDIAKQADKGGVVGLVMRPHKHGNRIHEIRQTSGGT
jgi:hypothetical protein